MSRRNFLKQGSILATSMLFHETIFGAVNNIADRKIRIAVIGCGSRGQGIIEILQELPDQFELTAVCDDLDLRFAETRAVLKGKKAREYKDYKKLLAEKDIEAVIIAVPLYLHFQIAKDALLAGKHVYLEKTMTYNIPQALELVQLSKHHSQQILQIGHQYRYTPLYYKVREMVQKGYLGKVTDVDCRWDRNGSWRRPVPEPSLERKINWRMYREYSGGLAAELLSHQIDFINWIFETHPDSVYATGGIDFYKDGRETEDNIQAVFRYGKDNMIGNFGATCTNSSDGYLFKLKGTKGTIKLLVDKGVYYPEKEQKKELKTVDGVTGATKIEWAEDGGIPILQSEGKDGTWYALADFHKCVVNKTQPDSNVLTGARTAIAVQMINQSIQNKDIRIWKPEYSVI